MKFGVWTALGAFLLIAGASAYAAIDCETLLESVVMQDLRAERKILETIDPETAKFSGGNKKDSWIFTLPSGDQILFRLPKKGGHSNYEIFANHLMRNAPGVLVPFTRLLTQKETEALFKKVGLDAGEPILRDDRGTVRLVYPGMTTGPNYLNATTLSNLREEILDLFASPQLARAPEMNDPSLQVPAQKLIEDLKKLFPEKLADLNRRNFVERVRSVQNARDSSRLSSLNAMEWDHLPPTIQRQLAEGWALHNVLALRLRADSWSIHANTVILTEPVFQDKVFHDGLSRFDLNEMNPVTTWRITKELEQKMLRAIRPQVARYLMSIRVSQIKYWAKGSRLRLSDKGWEICGLMNRIRLLIKAYEEALAAADAP